jgi:hypothetical protein
VKPVTLGQAEEVFCTDHQAQGLADTTLGTCEGLESLRADLRSLAALRIVLALLVLRRSYQPG